MDDGYASVKAVLARNALRSWNGRLITFGSSSIRRELASSAIHSFDDSPQQKRYHEEMLTLFRNKHREDEEKAEFRRQRRIHGRVQQSGDIKLQSVSRDGSPFEFASPTSPASPITLELRILTVANKAGMPEEPVFHERPQPPSDDEPQTPADGELEFFKTPQSSESEDEPAVGSAEEPHSVCPDCCPDLQGSMAALFHTHLEKERASNEEMDIRTRKWISGRQMTEERTRLFWEEFPAGCPPGFAGTFMQRGRVPDPKLLIGRPPKLTRSRYEAADLAPADPNIYVEDGVRCLPGQEVKRRIEHPPVAPAFVSVFGSSGDILD